MNLAACSGLPTTPENSVWYRLVDPAHIGTPLHSAHSKLSVTRFSAGRFLPAAQQFETLYFADDPLVAQFEVGAVLGTFAPGAHVPHPKLSFITLNVNIILHSVVDLTEVKAAQDPLETNAQELTGDWRGYGTRHSATPISQPTGIAPTQALGRALFQTGIEGFRTVSAKMPCNRLLIVFTENLQKGSSLTFYHHGMIVHQIKP